MKRESRNSSKSTQEEVAALREQLATTKENYNDALRELRNERVGWKKEKRWLENARKSPSVEGESEHLSKWLEERAQHELHLEKYANQIKELKETVQTMRQENKGLRDQVSSLKKPNHPATMIIQDLEEEVTKWETLYFETAELGASRMRHLEQELEGMRSNQATVTHAQDHIQKLHKKLKATFSSAHAKRKKLKEYKQKSRQRVTLLKELLEQAQAEKEKELLKAKAQQEDEISLLDQIENLENQLSAKGIILERERAQAAKREAALSAQLHAARKLADLDPEYDQADVCSIFLRKLPEQLCGVCMEWGKHDDRTVVANRPVLL